MVGIQFVSYFSPNFLYQHTIVPQSYRDLHQLECVYDESMPEMLRPYAIAKSKNPELWTTKSSICAWLEKESHKQLSNQGRLGSLRKGYKMSIAFLGRKALSV